VSDILLVDDDAASRQELRAMIAASQYSYLSVSEADTAERALFLVKQEQPSILFSEVSLPDMDGIEFACKAMESGSRIQAVAMTHLEMFETVYRAINSGFSGYLLKPVSSVVLFSTLQRLMRTSLTKMPGEFRRTVSKSDPKSDVDLRNPIKSAVQFIEEHFAEPISLQDVADLVYLSPSYFSRLFKTEMGVTFTEYLTQYRIQRSKMLLRVTTLPIEIVANSAGFSNASYFSTIFKRLEGRTPSEYRSLFAALQSPRNERSR
jgi:two-component system response regulator YesN